MEEGVREKIQVQICVTKVLETDGMDTMSVTISDTKAELKSLPDMIKLVVRILLNAQRFSFSFLDSKINEKRT